METLTDFTYNSIKRYYTTLSNYGYKSYKDVNKLLILLYLDWIFTGPFQSYITDEDYKILSTALYSLYGTTCLIPFPDIFVNTPLIHETLGAFILKITEDGDTRNTEDSEIRVQQ